MAEPATSAAVVSIAFRFDDFETAGKAYERARDLIFSEDLNASAYRVQINAVTHVIIVGEDVPDPRLQNALPEICTEGELAEIADEVVLMLALRRASVSGSRLYGLKPSRSVVSLTSNCGSSSMAGNRQGSAPLAR